MKFLADENFPRAAVQLIKASGFDVASVAEDHPGADDLTVLTRCAREQRTLLTLDRILAN